MWGYLLMSICLVSSLCLPNSAVVDGSCLVSQKKELLRLSADIFSLLLCDGDLHARYKRILTDRIAQKGQICAEQRQYEKAFFNKLQRSRLSSDEKRAVTRFLRRFSSNAKRNVLIGVVVAGIVLVGAGIVLIMRQQQRVENKQTSNEVLQQISDERVQADVVEEVVHDRSAPPVRAAEFVYATPPRRRSDTENDAVPRLTPVDIKNIRKIVDDCERRIERLMVQTTPDRRGVLSIDEWRAQRLNNQ